MNASQKVAAERIAICQLCRKRVHRMINGEWYHSRNASVFCHPGDGTHRKVILLEIDPRR